MTSSEIPKWVQLQQKTMIRWINSKLAVAKLNPDLPKNPQISQISNLNLDLQSGLVLIQITNQIIYETNGEFYITPIYLNPKFKIQKLENLIDYLKFIDLILKINIGNLISAQDIFDCNQKLVLGFIWSLFLFSINTIENSFTKVKKVLLDWLNNLNLEIDNFNLDWSVNSGNLLPIFITIFNHYNLNIHFDSLDDVLLYLQDDLKLPHLIDYDDFNEEFPDEKCIVPFVIELFKYFELNDEEDEKEGLTNECKPEEETNDINDQIERVHLETHDCDSIPDLQSNSSELSSLQGNSPISAKQSLLQPVTIERCQELDSNNSTAGSSTLKVTDLSPPTFTLSTPYSVTSTSSESTILLETFDDLVELIISTHKLKQDYESNALKFFDKVNTSIFQLTNLLVIEDSTGELNAIISSLDLSNIEPFLVAFHAIVKQLVEMAEMLDMYESYTLREKPQLFYSDFSQIVDHITNIDLNLEQLDLKYIPSMPMLQMDNIRTKISTLIDLDYEIIDHLKPVVEVLQTVDLNIIFEMLESATIKYKDDANKKLVVVKCLDDFDLLYSIIDKMDRYYEIFSISVQPENMDQLDEQISKKEVPSMYNLNSDKFQQFKTTLSKYNNNSKLSQFELVQLLKSFNVSQNIIKDFIDLIPTEDIDSINDSDFELNSSSASTSSISSSDDKIFDESANQTSSSKAYDLGSMIYKIENGFSI